MRKQKSMYMEKILLCKTPLLPDLMSDHIMTQSESIKCYMCPYWFQALIIPHKTIQLFDMIDFVPNVVFLPHIYSFYYPHKMTVIHEYCGLNIAKF